MAEVLLARASGLGGFARHVVIKRIRFDEDVEQKSTSMFLQEARLVASLHHHNIVQVHDVGEEDGKCYFVMEYVHGRDTRELLRHVKDQKQQIPLEHVVAIVSAAAAGLHYAHEQRGADRKPLGIVHRDISPGNILIGFDGGVKVADFGIAKTEQSVTQTGAGELKGKSGYMSPEQCRAQPVDRRTDIFLLGIVLYELLTVRRLFRADTRFATMQMIVDGNVVPPSTIREDIPPELEHIVLKALSPSPADRYQTADEMRLALEAFATSAGLTMSPARLSDYLKQQFGDVVAPWLLEETAVQPLDIPPPEPKPVVARESEPTIEIVRNPTPNPDRADTTPDPEREPARLPSIPQGPAPEAAPELAAIRVAKPIVDGKPSLDLDNRPVSYPIAPTTAGEIAIRIVGVVLVLAGVAAAVYVFVLG